MKLRTNLDETVWVAGDAQSWVASGETGVSRCMLDRDGDEIAVATSLVRYAPGSSFAPHSHDLGEEFIVLQGVFSDEAGDYPAGTYVRNPPGSRHRPHSDGGCLIFVKLRQFHPLDSTPVVADLAAWPQTGPAPAAAVVRSVYAYGEERVSAVRVPAGTRFAFAAAYHVRELLVLAGELTWQQEQTYRLGPHSWIRMAPGEPLRINAVTDCVIFSKTRPVYPGSN